MAMLHCGSAICRASRKLGCGAGSRGSQEKAWAMKPGLLEEVKSRRGKAPVNAYTVLGLSRNCNSDQIDAAHRCVLRLLCLTHAAGSSLLQILVSPGCLSGKATGCYNGWHAFGCAVTEGITRHDVPLGRTCFLLNMHSKCAACWRACLCAADIKELWLIVCWRAGH